MIPECITHTMVRCQRMSLSGRNTFPMSGGAPTMLLATLTTQETYRATSGSGITASSRIQHNGSTGKSGTIHLRDFGRAQECDRGSWIMVGADGGGAVWEGAVEFVLGVFGAVGARSFRGAPRG